MVVALALALGACTTAMPPGPEQDRATLDEFRHEMTAFARKTGDYREQARHGSNPSEMTLGWFIYDLLTVLSSQDDALYQHFNPQGRDLQSYLRTVFRNHQAEEVDAIEALSRIDHPTRRLAARYGLEVLRHIPDPAEPKETQAADRRDLADALDILQKLLQRSAEEVVLPPP
jgi:hypothetical protein